MTQFKPYEVTKIVTFNDFVNFTKIKGSKTVFLQIFDSAKGIFVMNVSLWFFVSLNVILSLKFDLTREYGNIRIFLINYEKKG